MNLFNMCTNTLSKQVFLSDNESFEVDKKQNNGEDVLFNIYNHSF